MRLKEGLLSHKIGDEYVTVAAGKAGEVFNGMLRSNQTASDILKMLETDTKEERIVDALFQQYSAAREEIAEDVHRIIVQLKAAGLLDE